MEVIKSNKGGKN